ncbi:MAG: hypothetical protein JW704_11560, partial [Anaerolineaceae bacterium]|nr:hypothetical protein [Anaerolineaceae bacterium]
VGLALALLGSAVFFVTNNPFSLLSLGDILGWISLAGYISLIVFPMIVERRANKNMKHQSQG